VLERPDAFRIIAQPDDKALNQVLATIRSG
jgi:hypothetical protein